jgi:hypothetical protein
MNVLRKLTAVASEEDMPALRFATAQHDEPVPGFIRQAKFGPPGLLLISRDAQVLIPMDELFALAQAIDPAFNPPVQVQGPKSKV